MQFCDKGKILCTAQHSTAQHSTAQHSTAQHSTAQHNYVISLTTAKERREHIIQEFGKQNISFEFFDAITPETLNERAAELGIDISKSALTKGEISCALSHIAIIHLAKKRNLEYVCIFEDDVYLGQNAKAFLKNDYISNNVDIVKIEKNFDIVLTSIFSVKEHLERKFYKLTAVNPGCGGYIVTKKGIDYIVSKIKSIDDIEIDNLFFREYLKDSNFTVWQMSPAVCIQDCLLNPQNSRLGVMGGEGGERDQRRSKKNKKKAAFYLRLAKELKRPFTKLKKKLLGKKSYFK